MEIRYDHETHSYQVVAGDRVLADHERRPDAELDLLKRRDPQVARWVRKLAQAYPVFALRAYRAGHLVVEGHVSPDGHPHHYHVESQTRPDVSYTVGIPPEDRDSWTCTCPDYTTHQAPDVGGDGKRRRCKHMGAAFIYAQVTDRAEVDRASAESFYRLAAEAADRGVRLGTIHDVAQRVANDGGGWEGATRALRAVLDRAGEEDAQRAELIARIEELQCEARDLLLEADPEEPLWEWVWSEEELTRYGEELQASLVE